MRVAIIHQVPRCTIILWYTNCVNCNTRMPCDIMFSRTRCLSISLEVREMVIVTTMDFFANYYYRLLRFLLSVVGEWPYYESRYARFRRLVFFTYVLFFIVQQVLMLTKINYEVGMALEIIPNIVVTTICLMKFTFTWANRTSVRHLLDWIRHDWAIFTATEEVVILHKYADKARIFGMFYVYTFEIALGGILIAQLSPAVLDILVPLNHTRPGHYVLEVEYFFDPSKHYYAVVLYTTFTLHVGVWIVASHDIVYVTCVFHACAVCAIVSLNFINLFENVNEHACRSGEKCVVRQKLAQCITQHEMLIRYTDYINSCYTNAFGWECAVGTISLVFILLRLFKGLVVSQDLNCVLINIMYISGQCALSVVVILPAQMLLDCSSELFYKIYFGRWYTGCPAVQKMLILVMQQGGNPLTLYIANYMPLSFEGLVSVMQMSISYFSVLCSMYDTTSST